VAQDPLLLLRLQVLPDLGPRGPLQRQVVVGLLGELFLETCRWTVRDMRVHGVHVEKERSVAGVSPQPLLHPGVDLVGFALGPDGIEILETLREPEGGEDILVLGEGDRLIAGILQEFGQGDRLGR